MIRHWFAWTLPLLLIVLLIASLPAMYDAVEASGRFIIGQRDIRGDYFTAVLWASILAGVIFLLPINSEDKRNLLLLWLAKVAVALGFMLFYEYTYGLDSYSYYETSKQGEFSWNVLLHGNGTRNIINLLRLHQLILPDSYHAAKVTFAAIGLFSAYILYRAISNLTNTKSTSLFFIIALFPSVLFWSSILGKDPIVFLGVCIYVYGVLRWRYRSDIWSLTLVFMGLGVVSIIRLWMVPILGVPFLALVFAQNVGFLKKLIIASFTIVIATASAEAMLNTFLVQTADDLVNTAGKISQGWALGGSAQVLNSTLSNFSGFLSFLPLGMFTALFRPLPGEVANIFGILAGLENVFLLLLMVIATFRTRLSELKEPLVIWGISAVLIWAMVYGFISYQNLGSAVRFKLQILPVLLPLLLYLARRRT